MTGAATVDEVAAELADLADAVLEAALAISRAELPPDATPVRFAVVAMGKCGARELNYASDIDVIFVAEPHRPAATDPAGQNAGEPPEEAALKTATRLAAGLIRACERTTPEGALFPVDPNLRPEGRQGPLVRTLASHLAYYDRWAKTWEFQALLKARPAAGDLALGQRYADAVAPLVWQASQRENFVEDVQAMRRRVIDTLPKNMAGRELKLGPGGLRDIEFAVQLLQLVHGRVQRAAPRPRHAPGPGRPRRRGLRRPRRRRGPRAGVPVPAPDRAPAPAVPAAPHAHAADRPRRPAPPRPGARRGATTHAPERAVGSPGSARHRRAGPRSPAARPGCPGRARRHPAGAGVHRGVDEDRAAGPPPAREAVLPAAARRGGEAAVERGAAHPGGRARPP